MYKSRIFMVVYFKTFCMNYVFHKDFSYRKYCKIEKKVRYKIEPRGLFYTFEGGKGNEVL